MLVVEGVDQSTAVSKENKKLFVDSYSFTEYWKFARDIKYHNILVRKKRRWFNFSPR